MSILRDAMHALSSELVASVKRTEQLEHNLTKGELREDALRNGLRPHIPRRYELTSGIVVNTDGAQSKQQDLIVSDGVENPSFIASGGLAGSSAGVQPVEAVVATLELKSVATGPLVEDGVGKALSVAALLPDGPRSAMKPGIGAQLVKTTQFKPFAGFVALSSSASRDTLLSAWTSTHEQRRPWDRLQAIAVVGDFFACWANEDGHWAQLSYPGADRIAVVSAGDDSLLLLYILMMLGIRDYPAPTLDLSKYAEAAGIEPAVELLDPGVNWAAS